MSDDESGPEVLLVACDLIAELLHRDDDVTDELFLRAIRPKRRLKCLALEFRNECVEREPATQCVIDHGKRPIRGVHHAEDVEVLWKLERRLGVRERHRELPSAFVSLDQHQQLAEDLSEIAAVDLVDDEDEFPGFALERALRELVKDAVAQLEAAAFLRSVSFDEV